MKISLLLWVLQLLLCLAALSCAPSSVYLEGETGEQCTGRECGPFGTVRVGVAWDVHHPRRTRAAVDGGAP